MILSSLAFATVAAQPSLAYIARFYKPGAAKSRFEIYVSNLDGSNQKKLTSTDEPHFIHWIGKDRLAWTTEKGVYTSKLSPWKPALVKNSANYNFRESRWRTSEPGQPDFMQGFDDSKGFFHLNPQSLKLEPTTPTNNPDEYTLSDETTTDVANPCDANHSLSMKKYEAFHYWAKGAEVQSDFDAMRAIKSDGGKSLWVVTGTHDSTTGDTNCLMLFQQGKQPRTIFDNANAFDLWWSRPTFAYCTTRELKSLGGKQVWTSELHVGDWTKGADKTIIKGLVWIPSVSIRPEA